MKVNRMPTSNDPIPPPVLTALHEGAQLYNDGAYWDAHEAWEEAWHKLQDEKRAEEAHVTQGLILATAAFENLRRGKPNGFRVQAAKALNRLLEHPGTATRLGITNEDAFIEALLSLYLDAQATRTRTLHELTHPPPKLATDPEPT